MEYRGVVGALATTDTSDSSELAMMSHVHKVNLHGSEAVALIPTNERADTTSQRFALS